ncbi:FAD:protein FMN transferase [uncultured Proteiniphilum sp.]|uniref:FAD:protein FMN transferase n=1 Tax=uncultured Proteiniphilum sp. TaxID=497637 RepID=UPI002612DE2A|nr:FAD:protein FMN transferase [uncultured Proteiniphilum sp.]
MKPVYSHYYENSCLFHGSILNIMGTGFDIIFIGKSKSDATKIWDQISSLLELLHARLNRFDESSEIAFVNLNAHKQAIKTSDYLWEILSDNQQYFEQTNGIFDITLGNFSQIELNETEKTVFFRSGNTKIDLGGYAKGYAIEKIKKILINNNIRDAFVDFGNSSVLAMGKHPHGDSWKLIIKNPFDQNIILNEEELSNKNISTSGNMLTHTMHIKNTRTGKFNDERKMVTVISDNAIEAEVISTSLMIAQPDEVDSIIQRFDIDKYKIYYL